MRDVWKMDEERGQVSAGKGDETGGGAVEVRIISCRILVDKKAGWIGGRKSMGFSRAPESDLGAGKKREKMGRWRDDETLPAASKQ